MGFGHHACSYDFSKDMVLGDEIINHVKNASIACGTLMIFKLPVFNFNPYIDVMNRARRCVDEFCGKEIGKRLEKRRQCAQDKSMINDEPDDILKALMDSSLSRSEIYEHMNTLLAAGHDTSASFGGFTTYLLAKHPDIQEKARQEVRSVLNGREQLTADDIPKLEYLHCVLKESFRIYTIIPGLPRLCTEDFMLMGKIFIPKNTTIYLPLTVSHRDGDTWENPREFKPERFYDSKIGESCAKKGYFPFSYGPRSCIGSTLAMTEAAAAISLLLTKFSFTQDDTFKLKIGLFGITLYPKEGLRVHVKPLNNCEQTTNKV